MKRIARVVVLCVLGFLAAPLHAQQGPPPKPAAAQDGFLPVDAPANPQDTMPAPALVAIAYGFIWVVFFGYVASTRMRLAKVEREIEAVTRRISAGSK